MDDYVIEPELARPAPRPVRPKAGWWGQRVLGFGLLLAFPVANLCMWTCGVKRVREVHDRGRVAVGVVEHLREVHGKSTSYHVDYSYRDGSGNSHSGHRAVSHSVFRSLTEGGPVDVTYLPENPGIKRLGRVTDRDVAHINWFAFFLFFGSGALCLGGFAACEKDARKHYALGERGQAAVGEVTELRVYRGKSTAYCVRYAFKDALGQTHSRQARARKQLYESLSEGTRLTILYDPKRPQVSLLYAELMVSVG